MQYKDYYKTLHVDKTADQDAIKKAYRKLAKEHHPDKHPNHSQSTDRFKEISEAYEVLGNPDKRKKYDQLSKQAAAGYGAEFDPSAFGYTYTNFGSGSRRGGARGFSDFFEAFFGEHNQLNMDDLFGHNQFSTGDVYGASHQYSMGNNGKDYTVADIEAELTLTPSEACAGVKKTLTIQIDQQIKTLSVKIPPGIQTGEKIKLKGQGQSIDNQGVSGDLYLHVNIKDTQTEKLEGLDLILQVPVTPWEAALGDVIRVNAGSGTVKLTIPPGTGSSKRFRLAGKGFRNRKGETGDLFIEVIIQMPPVLSDKEKDLLKEWKSVSNFHPHR